MEIFVSGKNMDIGKAFMTHIKEGVERTVKRYFDHTFDVTVTISKNSHEITSDISAHVGRGIMLRSNVSNTEPYISFDTALEKLEYRLKRYKHKLTAHHSKHETRDERKAIKYILSHDFGVPYHVEESIHEEAQPAVIAETSADLPLLTVGDAVMRMDLSDLPVFMFYNSAHKGLNVIYRREDGNIGWVDPEGLKNTKKIA